MLKKTLGENFFNVINHIFLILFSFICIYPLWYCLVSSISDPSRLALYSGFIFLPLGFSFKSYLLVMQNSLILHGVLYTVFLVVAGTSINLLITSLGAYALSRKTLYWRKAVTLFIIVTMYFSGGLIPYYIIITQYLHLQDTPWAILLPNAINTFNLIIMRTYFSGIPESMEESAKMEGANDFSVLFRIILPLSMPVVAVMIIYYGVSHWNGWFNAMIFLTKQSDWKPLQLILRDVLIQNMSHGMTSKAGTDDFGTIEQTKRLVKYALIMISTLPIIVLYPFMQKYFIGGVMIGSLKE